MISPVKYFHVHSNDIINQYNLERFQDHLEDYKAGGREDIFDNLDIFSENVRSKSKAQKDFSLFRKVNFVDDKTVIVCGMYLEILQFWGQEDLILKVIKELSEKFPNNKVVFQWNHDVDFRSYSEYCSKFSNIRVLNFNTSCQNGFDIVLPFWSIEKEFLSKKDKSIFANLICTVNNQLRFDLMNQLIGKQSFVVHNRLSKEDFFDTLEKSTFTFCPRGHGLSSYRFFECLFSGSIPVLFADDVCLPYQDDLNYQDLIVRLPESTARDFNKIEDALRSVDVKKMTENIEKNIEKFSLLGVQKKVWEQLSR